ncbi:MAG TPA: RluA family pseudouridine synthase [Candidatus Eisenbergiella stercorigallinarum]|uniref:RNA pseudouridylate synthase n=1 Tax=Candidatus Eisenbergiella stercorigallinarum TaxID=2838557 RepID=A0A9D2TZQ1_9FIRM|nr:RluA family pseudouridine synthase [Candidatus Eisenbergiella stercorigallinarum]
MKTQILWEDTQILVCLKPAGLAVQSARPGEADMVSELKNYLAASGKKDTPDRRKPPYLGVVHRLDQPVSGLLVFAKTPMAAASLSRQAAGNGMEKEYCALVYVQDPQRLAHISPEGYPDAGTGQGIELVDFLKKEPGQNLSRVVDARTPGAKRAQLRLWITDRQETQAGRVARVSVLLHTGRHHQIRVQLSHAGLPLLGDMRYGNGQSLACSRSLGIRSLCLCACRLDFTHPATGKKMVFRTEEFPWK